MTSLWKFISLRHEYITKSVLKLFRELALMLVGASLNLLELVLNLRQALYAAFLPKKKSNVMKYTQNNSNLFFHVFIA